MTVVTHVWIEPDWEMLFLGDECVAEGHSVGIVEALEAVKGEPVERVESYSIESERDVDFAERTVEIPVKLAENGPELLRDGETA